jgi:hypothetical protein
MARFLVAALLSLLAVGSAAGAGKPVRVLFIGNSLVATTDVPGTLERVGRAMGREVVAVGLTANDFSLEDHWRDGQALARIREGWDFVVLQQGPSARPDSRVMLVDYAKRFAAPIRAAGAKPVVFSAWPARNRQQDYPEAIRSHRIAAESADAILIPAAETWLRAYSADKRLDLYADGLHASALGGQLAVLATWFALFPAGPQEFDEAYVARLARALDLPPAKRDALVDAATRAIDEPIALK